MFGAVLGEGAYATVVHAKLKENDCEFAIKVVEKMHIKRENKVKYVMMERNIMSSISHALIVKLYYSFQCSDYLYFCMDVAHGGELSAYIRACREEAEVADYAKGLGDDTRRACSEEASRFYVGELLAAVAYLHSKRIIHRDVKPENILVHKSGHLKLTDFGTALQLPQYPTQCCGEEDGDDGDTDGSQWHDRVSFVGTADYVSPEVLMNEAVTGACDLWAVGCVLFNMLTGTTPFSGMSEYLTFQNITSHAKRKGDDVSKGCGIDFPEHVSESARDAIWGLLRPSVKDRLGYGGKEGQWAAVAAALTEAQELVLTGAVDTGEEEEEAEPEMLRTYSDSTSSLKPPSVPMCGVDPTYPMVRGHSFFGGLQWGSTFACVAKAAAENGIHAASSSGSGSGSDGNEGPALWKQRPLFVPDEESFPTRDGAWRDGTEGWFGIDEDVLAFQQAGGGVGGGDGGGDGSRRGSRRISKTKSSPAITPSEDLFGGAHIRNSMSDVGSAKKGGFLGVFGGRGGEDTNGGADDTTPTKPRFPIFHKLVTAAGAARRNSAPEEKEKEKEKEKEEEKEGAFLLEGDRTKWRNFCDPAERLVFTSVVWKRKGLFSKKRQLILTDTPRLFYVDAENMRVAGEVPWTLTDPVQPKQVSETEFDVFAQENSRYYHFSTQEEVGSNIWCDLIEGAALEYGLKDITPSNESAVLLSLDSPTRPSASSPHARGSEATRAGGAGETSKYTGPWDEDESVMPLSKGRSRSGSSTSRSPVKSPTKEGPPTSSSSSSSSPPKAAAATPDGSVLQCDATSPMCALSSDFHLTKENNWGAVPGAKKTASPTPPTASTAPRTDPDAAPFCPSGTC